MTMTLHGSPTSGKPINLHQLQGELETAGVDCSRGLGMANDVVFTYDDAGGLAEFPAASQAAVDQAIASHVAMRDKTDAEFATEFQASSDPVRKQEIRDMQAGLLPREEVPM